MKRLQNLEKRIIFQQNNIEPTKPEFSSQLIEFQIRLAKQTEGIDLNPETVKKAFEYLSKEMKYKHCFVKLHPERGKPIGSIILIHENKNIFWAISAYVSEKDREQGIFIELSYKVRSYAKQKKIQIVKLFVEKRNLKAIKAYEKIGFKNTGELFYGYDFVFGPPYQGVELNQKVPECYTFLDKVEREKLVQVLDNFQFFLDRRPQTLSRQVACFVGQQMIGYCQYFEEFCLWRYGINICITVLYVKEKMNQRRTIEIILSYLYQKCEMKVTMIKFLLRNKEDIKVVKLLPKGDYLPYFIMQDYV